MELYQSLAGLAQARINCIKNNNQEWLEKHTDKIETLLYALPHGSGINGKWYVDYTKTHGNKITLTNTYDTMNENGYYDTVVNFSLTILPSLQFGFEMHIRGNFGKYQDVKDYLYDILRESLSQEVTL